MRAHTHTQTQTHTHTHTFGLHWVIARRRAYTRGCVSRDDESRLGGHVIRASMQSMLCCMRVVCHVSAFALGLVSTILIPGPHAMIESASTRPLFAIFTCEFFGARGFRIPGVFRRGYSPPPGGFGFWPWASLSHISELLMPMPRFGPAILCGI